MRSKASALVVLVLIALPAPTLVGLEGPLGAASAFQEGENQTITSPAFLFLQLFWDDGGERIEPLKLDLFRVEVRDIGGSGYSIEVHDNPIPVPNSITINVRIYPLSIRSEAVADRLYDGSYTSGAAGSYHTLSLYFNTSEISRAQFYPTRVIFRPYDAATGAGLPIEQFNLTVQFPAGGTDLGLYDQSAEVPIGLGYFDTYFGLQIRLRVRDYFGNELYNQTRTFKIDESVFCVQVSGGNPGECGVFANTWVTWDIPLSVYSVKFYNQKPDQFVKFGLHWNGTGAGEEVFSPNGQLEPSWWNSQWAYRQRLVIEPETDVSLNYTVNMTLPASSLAGKMQPDYRDLRVVRWNGSAWIEAARNYNGSRLTFKVLTDDERPAVTPSQGAWPLEEGTGTTAGDSSGNGNTLTLNSGASWISGRYGNGLALDGVNDHATSLDSPSLSLTGALTLSAWIYTNTASAQQGIIEKYSPAPANGYTLRLTSAGKLFGATINAGLDTQLTTAATVSTGVWHHAAYVYTGTTHALYLDGLRVASAANTRNPADSSVTLKIGARGDDAAMTFNGMIDEPRVRAFAMTDNDVACEARAPTCVIYTPGESTTEYYLYYGNTIATTAPTHETLHTTILGDASNEFFFPLDETTGSTTADLGPSGVDGTINGATLGVGGMVNTSFHFVNPDNITVPSIFGIGGTGATLECFLYVADTTEQGPCLKMGEANGFALGVGNSNLDTSGNNFAAVFEGIRHIGTGIPIGTGWHQLVLVITSAGKPNFYLDGNLVYSDMSSSPIAPTGHSKIGGYDTRELSDARVDNVAGFSSHLPDATIKNHYTRTIEENSSITAVVSLDTSRGFEWFQSPQETVERFLNPGYYTLHVITDDRTGVQSFASLGLNISEANYVMVSGLNITRFVGDFVTIQNQQVILSNQLRPDVIYIGEHLPTASAEINSPAIYGDYVLIHPFSILTGTTSYTGEGGAIVTLYGPSMESDSGDGALLTTMTVTQDTYVFSGASTAHVWINDTEGNNLWENASLPPSVTLPGFSGDVVVESNASITTQRVSDFRAIWEFNVRHYNTTKRYEQSLTLNNTMNRTVLNPQWFVGFPENKTINLTTAMVQDLDNDVWLTLGRHYTTTQAGYYMDFDVLNASAVRRFFFVFYDLNASATQSTQILQISEILPATYKDSSSYWVGAATLTNPYTSVFDGDVAIKLTCKECSKVQLETIEIVDETRGRTLDLSEFYASGNTIVISRGAVGNVPVGGSVAYKVYFKLELTPETTGPTVFGSIVVIAGFAISPFLIILGSGIALAIGGIITDERRRRWSYLGASSFALSIAMLALIARGQGWVV